MVVFFMWCPWISFCQGVEVSRLQSAWLSWCGPKRFHFGQVLSPLCCCCFKIQAFSFLLFVNLDCTKIPSRVILIHVEHPALNNILLNVIFPTKVCSMKYWKRLKLHLLLRPHQKFQECMNMQIWRCLQAQWRAASHPPIKCRWSDYT